MYKKFYRFSAEPFRLTPDPSFCFPHRSYEKAKAYMQYALDCAEGFVIVTGNPGTGKTTLIHDLINSLDRNNIKACAITNTLQLPDDVLRTVALSFELKVEGLSKPQIVERLSDFLVQQHKKNLQTLLIVDEAQDFSLLALEELRLLTNMQMDNKPLIQIFLVGQEGLRDLIQWPVLEQLRQRVVATTHLDPLELNETEAYIKHRLKKVGWHRNNPIIRPEVYPLIQEFSGGVPRLINLACNRLLLSSAVEGKNEVTIEDAMTVISELLNEGLGHQEALATYKEIKKEEEKQLVVGPGDGSGDPELHQTGLKPAFAPPGVADERTAIYEEKLVNPESVTSKNLSAINRFKAFVSKAVKNTKKLFSDKWPYFVTGLSLAVLLLVVFWFKPSENPSTIRETISITQNSAATNQRASSETISTVKKTLGTSSSDSEALGLNDPLMKSVMEDVIKDIYGASSTKASNAN
ncbi:MAG: hypothetical protein AXA67_00570 [Methylothermaceae bacteria B42]|nr:MAG: hypothetical protein AXA67_00570 [Methylothermaceae bacteria B42]HHJ38791.1 DUF2075 domain-containing protein [Methylothermaceae bacterium]